MTLTVAQVIDEARDHHAALSETNAPSKLLLRELRRGLRELFTQIAPRVPEFVALSVSVDVATIDFTTGAAVDLGTLIPDGWLDLTQVSFTWTTAPSPGASRPVVAKLVPFQQRGRSPGLPAVTFRDNVLYILGPESVYAPRFGTMEIQYTPNPEAVTLSGDIPALPDDVIDCLGLRLAAFGVSRLRGNPSFDIDQEAVDSMRAESKEATRAFLRRVYRLSQRQDHRMRDVNADPGGPWVP